MTGPVVVIDLMEELKKGLAKRSSEEAAAAAEVPGDEATSGSLPTGVAGPSSGLDSAASSGPRDDEQEQTMATAAPVNDDGIHVPLPKPGLYRGLSYQVYAAWPARNHSTLSEYGRSAAHGLHAELTGGADSPALAFGSAVHTAILEPERFKAEYAPAPAGLDRRTKEGRAVWDRLRSSGRAILRADEFEAAVAMAQAARSTPFSRALLEAPGANEVSFTWLDPDTREPMKGRADRICSLYGTTWVVDVKSTRDARPHAFKRDLAQFGYHEQAALYLDGLHALAPVQRRFLWIAIEKDPPYAVACYEPQDQALIEGRKRNREQLSRYIASRESGVWPGYPDGPQPIYLPNWALTTTEEQIHE